MGAISRADVVEFLDGLEREEGLRHQVNRCRETLRAIFAYAIERDRTLNAEELTALWRAIDELPELARAYFRVVLLTGARRNEVRCLAWSEVDGRAFELPLSQPVVETLRALPRIGPMIFALDGR